jgi:kinetochore protein Spc7/SPC105
MVTFGDDTLPSSRRARKSVGAHTDMRKGLDKENATVDIASELAASRKKSRSKSMGPGGLDTLKPGTGNRRVVGNMD